MKISIVSGYFNPLNPGHLEMLEAAKEVAKKLIVIVNNDIQVLEKEGEVVFNEKERIDAVKKVKFVDEVVLSIDKDHSVKKTLKEIAKKNKKDDLTFCNGGSLETSLDIPETEVCREFGIKLEFGTGENMDDSLESLLG
jgi:cytidyltransferase-like protein